MRKTIGPHQSSDNLEEYGDRKQGGGIQVAPNFRHLPKEHKTFKDRLSDAKFDDGSNASGVKKLWMFITEGNGQSSLGCKMGFFF